MKKTCLSIAALVCAVCATAKEQITLAEDDASTAAYGSGWKSDGGGTGFGSWTFRENHGEGQSHGGRFVAERSNNPEIGAVGPKGKAFGLYANGNGFEASTAFRPLAKPLQVGESFSFLMKNGAIEKKFAEDDPGTGSIGLTLRSGNSTDSAEDYNKGTRFEFGCYEGQSNFQVYDGEENHDTGVALTDQGVSVTITLTGPDVYDLEIMTLGDKKLTKLNGRKLANTGSIESFCIFNRDGEKADGFFNGFQVSKPGE